MEILGLVDVPTWLILLLAVAVLLYIYGTWTHTTFSSQGIPGPKPLPLLGNVLELLGKGQVKAYRDWGKEYGKVYGHFLWNPILVVTDLDMLKEVMVKSFPNFVDRNIPGHFVGPAFRKGLFFLGGTPWKRIRNMMTPAFSGGKLKLMAHYIDRCSKYLMDNIEQHATSKKDVDIKEVFGGFTMDVIAGTAFGLETNSQTEEDEPFVTHCKQVFVNVQRSRFTDYLTYLIVMFPFLGPILRFIRFTFARSAPFRFFVGALEQLIDERQAIRKTQQKRRPDMLQMLVDAEADAADIRDLPDASDTAKSHKRLTKEEIVSQGCIVFAAGYETTATTLQYLTYNLALNPEAQEKLHEEIIQNIGQADPTYENISSLKYLDAAIHETLRLFPPVTLINRKAKETTTIKGVQIPAGTGVIIPIHTIMHSSENFDDPEKFDPERFLGSNRDKLDPMLIDLPFGYGPRQCIGMRLALLEIKFAAVRIYRTFRFLKCPDTPEKITLGKSFVLAVPDATIKVKAEVRAA